MKTLIALLTLLLLAAVLSVSWEGTGEAQTLPPAPERFWTDNICPQDVTAPPVTCTFLRTEGSTVRVPLIDVDGTTYGMILIDAGHVTFVQATATPLLDLNTASEDALTYLPRDEFGQRLGLIEARSIIQSRPYTTLDDLHATTSRAGLEPAVIAAIRACECTLQR